MSEINDVNDVRIYLGPTLHKRVMVHGSCYRGGLPAAVERITTSCPEVGAMIVPVDKIVETKRKSETEGTEQHRVYNYLRAVRFDADNRVRGAEKDEEVSE